MILILDVGNTHIYAGCYDNDKLNFSFRLTTAVSTSDMLGVQLKAILRENNITSKIDHVGISSVVPNLDYSLRAACIKYFNVEPFFIHGGLDLDLIIKIKQPKELGADLIAGALGAMQHFPNKNIIIVDYGTATTYSSITKNKEFLGVAITPGIRTSMQALELNTAKLPSIAIEKPDYLLGRDTHEALVSGIYYLQRSMLRSYCVDLANDVFGAEEYLLIGTGGFSALFKSDDYFDAIMPDLVLDGIYSAIKK
jgi:type III pantothenate kinase